MVAKKRGDYVKVWFDTGALGATICLGIVTKAGPATYTVRWESGRTNRVAQSYRGVEHVDDPDLLALAKKNCAAV